MSIRLNIFAPIRPKVVEKILNPLVKGSVSTREASAKAMFSEFYRMREDIFLRKEKLGKEAVVTKEELEDLFEKVTPKIPLDINIFTPVKNGPGGTFHVQTDWSCRIVEGYELNIQFPNNKEYIKKSDFDSMETLDHESCHFFKAITEPKYTVRNISIKLPFNVRRQKSYYYNTYLYQNELKKTFILKKKFLQNKEPARIDNVKKGINKFFNKNKFSSLVKVEMLQDWRLGLKDEIAAWNQGLKSYIEFRFPLNELTKKLQNGKELKLKDYARDSKKTHTFLDKSKRFNSKQYKTLDEKIQALNSFVVELKDWKCKAVIDDILFLNNKKQIVEEFLAQEIAKVRAKQKELVERGSK